ncbi:rhamnogalacturonan acetylesterase [Paenibacillus kandeliae]|uniref:rhamnogalacturonan acetylesterase n=1 Tax=Paenibacillus kandeliae TaxID=3231269 RepID=UPI00345A6695
MGDSTHSEHEQHSQSQEDYASLQEKHSPPQGQDASPLEQEQRTQSEQSNEYQTNLAAVPQDIALDAERQTAEGWRFDAGPGMPVEGYLPLTPDTVYTSELGYGFLPGSEVYARDRTAYREEEGTPTCKPTQHLQAAFCIPLQATFVLDVPDGCYLIRIQLGDWQAATHTILRAAGSKMMVPPIRTLSGHMQEVLFSVPVHGGRLELNMSGQAPRLNTLNITPAPHTLQLLLAGDSTVTDQPADGYPYAGWGQLLPERFKHDVCVDNHAISGRSSKSFADEGRLETIREQLRAGDYLWIAFGHNDAKTDAARHTDPFTTYKQQLTEYILTAREKEAHPVLLTPIQRRYFTEDGQLEDTHGDYVTAVRELAVEQQVPLIDLAAKTATLLQQLGPEQSKELFVWLYPGEYMNFPNGVQDNTHLQEQGARQIAGLVIESIRELHLQPLVMYMR